MDTRLRQPIVVVLGHVDHGKTSLLDKMRGTIVAVREAGGITQHIGASLFPLDSVIETCKALLGDVKIEKLKVPGLLFIDTPGHAAFANLRKRGGSIADLAILVIDIINGVQEQTRECIQLLKSRRTPFVVAANKIDLIQGWRSSGLAPFSKTFESQSKLVQEELEKRIYELVGELSFFGFKADLYTRIRDFTKTLAIVPVSAKTGEGIPDLLLILLGLAQSFMKDRLLTSSSKPAEGVVLEVLEEIGIGHTVNAIISDGILKVGDKIALMGMDGPFSTRVKALLMPKPLDEIRDPRDRFRRVEEVEAAVGVKIVAEGLDKCLAGSPIYVISTHTVENEILERIKNEIQEFMITTDKIGVVVKTDTLGSLEAATLYLHEKGIPVRRADIGELSKRDIVEAEAVRMKDELRGVILAFNVKVDSDLEIEANDKGIKIFKDTVLFRLVNAYLEWVEKETTKRRLRTFESLMKPGKIKIMEGYVFRRSDPAIVGVEILAGTIKPKYPLMNSRGKIIGTISQIQDKGQSIHEASTGAKVAISMREPTVGRHVREGEILYTALPEQDARLLQKEYYDMLDEESKKALQEILEVKRSVDPLWAR